MIKKSMKIMLFLMIFQIHSILAGTLNEYNFFQTNGKVNTDALIIKLDDKVILEKYARGYTPDTKHLSWSVAKTIAGILVAQAIEQKYLTIDERLYSLFPGFKGAASVKDVLQMSSGIAFKEVYSGIPVTADVTKMLYLEGPQKGFSNYTLNLPLRKEKPGEHFYYSSGDTNILMAILKKRVPAEFYNDFPWINLFDPLGIEATFEQDATGVFVGSSYLYMKGLDYIKLAELLNNDGIFQTVQIIPKWYIQMMKEVAFGVQNPIEGTSFTRKYSSQITTNKELEYQYLSQDSLLMLGHQGQFVIASPKEKLSIVRLATDKGSSLDRNEFFAEVRKFISKTQSDAKETKEKKIPKISADALTIKDYLKVPKLITAIAAKEICSCLFVVKRSMDQCRKDQKISLPVVPLIRVVGNEVKAFMNLASSSTAMYRGKKLGCYLTGN